MCSKGLLSRVLSSLTLHCLFLFIIIIVIIFVCLSSTVYVTLVGLLKVHLHLSRI